MMIKNMVPVTKLIATFAFSFWALVMHTTIPLIILVVAELLILTVCGNLQRNSKAVGSLAVFAVFLGIVQLLGGGSVESAYVTGLRMMAMTVVFIILLTTTRLQDLTAAMVTQIKVPYEYAFMFTAALRFVPDFIAESKAVQEAQACRGLSVKGNVFKRMINYMSVIQPLMLKSLSRSETMALSLELRGFGSQQRHSFMSNVQPNVMDYALIGGMILISAVVIYLRIHGIV
ncbi:energy-coupling factor transport system permease protein [Megasphaera paucivorans]|uniref:Energy-coupling factor transport system permease protein n=1 Tax=Megasphaera paucivorans TaxID=349095 RepID=A0A1G9YDI5_9FIRM|nr:energy-coupling factor transport system permease protein [Megasphaera paucivorans]